MPLAEFDADLWILLLGRLHPLMLHLPIGLLIGLVWIELVASLRRKRNPESIAAFAGVRSSLALLTAIAGGAAVASGLALGASGDYQGTTFEIHRWGGIALGVLCVVLGGLSLRKKTGSGGARTIYLFTLSVGAVLMGFVGHLGGTLTHGEGFVTDPLWAILRSGEVIDEPAERIGASAPGWSPPADASSVASAPAEADPFARVAPIFVERCIGCHGESRQRSGLALHTPEAIFRGGNGGAVVVAGNPAASELLRRLRLDIDARGHMPPRSKPQLSEQEILEIEAWISAGARASAAAPDDGAKPPEPAPPPADSEDAAAETDSSLEAQPPGTDDAAPPDAPSSSPDPEALAALEAELIHAAPPFEGSTLLWLDASTSPAPIASVRLVELLTPVQNHVARLSLPRGGIDTALAELVAQMPRLYRLEIRDARLSAAAAAALAQCRGLRELVLSETPIADDVLRSLAQLPVLESIRLWQTGVSDAALAELRSARPALRVDTGQVGGDAPLETEAEPQFGSAAPLPGENPALAAINTVCPVSGTAVDLRFRVVFGGRVIGFCCNNCPQAFWADPQKFAGKLPAP